MEENRFPVNLLGKWLQVLIKGLDESVDEKTKKELMEKPVKVELKKAIGRGDKICQFFIHGIE